MRLLGLGTLLFTICMTVEVVAAQGGGDTTLTTTTIPTRAPSYDVQAVITKASQIDPVAGAAIQANRDNNTIGFAELSDPGIYGAHDYNTIALNPNYGTLVMAAALLHEFIHVTNCSGGQSSGNGTGGDNRVTDPCFVCIHAQMVADGFTHIQDWFCNLDNPYSTGVPPSVVCDVMKHVKGLAKTMADKCSTISTCTYPTFNQLANWDSPCPSCP